MWCGCGLVLGFRVEGLGFKGLRGGGGDHTRGGRGGGGGGDRDHPFKGVICTSFPKSLQNPKLQTQIFKPGLTLNPKP